MPRQNLPLLRVAATTTVAALAFTSTARAGDFVYRPGSSDPTVGMNIWKVTTTENVPLVEQQVQDMYASGLRQVTMIPIAYANPTTGAITSTNFDNSRGGMTNAELAAGIARARSLGMTVTVNPMIQPTDNSGRSDLYFDPINNAAVSDTFWSNYSQKYQSWASIAKVNGATRFSVGSEMEKLEGSKPSSQTFSYAPGAVAALKTKWTGVINDVDAVVGNSVQLGYHSNHWSFASANTKANLWQNGKIDYVSLSAYYDYDPAATFGSFFYPGRTGLASPTESLPVQTASSSAMVSKVETNFRNWIEQVVLAASGKPIVIQEFGIAPRNQATVAPWVYDWVNTQFLPSPLAPYAPTNGSPWPYDPYEARDAIEGVLRALDGKAARIEEINFWLWQWAGGFKAEPFGMRPGYTLTDDTTTSIFDESKTQFASDAVYSYLQTVPEPSVMVATALVLGGALQRRRLL